MASRICEKCGKEFRDGRDLKRHLARKTPCAPIIETGELSKEQKELPNKCKFCGRAYTSYTSMRRHMRTACQIAPREGNSDGMEKLYEYVLKKNAALEAEVKALRSQAQSAPATMASHVNRLALGASAAAPVAKSVQSGVVANVGAGGTFNANTHIDNSVGKTTIVNINVFGQEKLSRITKPQVIDLLRSLGPVGENVKAIAEKAIIQAAMLIFSDPAHPEDITCYLPNKKGDNALVHGETGWEMQPVGLVISPMAAQSIEVLFKHQPAPDQHTPENDVKWMMEECGNIMRYIQRHEGDMMNEPPRGELRGILIRNKEILQQVLAKLPLAGQQ
jgi:hypothetical protein